MSESIANIFRKRAEMFFSEHPSISHTFRNEGDSLLLTIPKIADDGFDVAMRVSSGEISVETGLGFHEHDCAKQLYERDVDRAVTMLQVILSERARIRVQLSNGRPYHWYLEGKVNDSWNVFSSMGLLFWNYFGRRSENTFSNRHVRPPEKLPAGAFLLITEETVEAQ